MNEFDEFNKLVNEYKNSTNLEDFISRINIVEKDSEDLEPQAKVFIGSGEDVVLNEDK